MIVQYTIRWNDIIFHNEGKISRQSVTQAAMQTYRPQLAQEHLNNVYGVLHYNISEKTLFMKFGRASSENIFLVNQMNIVALLLFA